MQDAEDFLHHGIVLGWGKKCYRWIMTFFLFFFRMKNKSTRSGLRLDSIPVKVTEPKGYNYSQITLNQKDISPDNSEPEGYISR